MSIKNSSVKVQIQSIRNLGAQITDEPDQRKRVELFRHLLESCFQLEQNVNSRTDTLVSTIVELNTTL